MAEGCGYRFKSPAGDGDGGITLKESKLKDLRLKFPDLDDEVLEDILTQTKGDVEEIVHTLGEEVVHDEEAEFERQLQQIQAQEAMNGTSELFEEIRGLSLKKSKDKPEPDPSLGLGCSNRSFTFGRGRDLMSSSNQAPYSSLKSTVNEVEHTTVKWDYQLPNPEIKTPDENYEYFDEALYDQQDSAFRESSDEESEEGDLVSLQLSPNLVEQLFSEYSNPFGNFDVKTLPAQDMQFRMPRKLAFDLYRHICLNLMDKVTEADATNGNSGSDDGDGFNELGGADGFEATPDLRQIMELEMRLQGEEARKVEKLRSDKQRELSLRISMKHLAEVFPSLPENVLESRFANMNRNYNATVKSLKAEYPQVYNEKANFDVTCDTRDLKDLASNDLSLLKEKVPGQYDAEDHYDQSPEDLRKLANQHFMKAREYDSKLKETSYTRGASQYYNSLSAEHYKKMKELHKEAMSKIFRRNNGPYHPATQIDLHHLTVKEAMPLLKPFLKMHEHSLNQSEEATLELKIICGKGRHSDKLGPKLLPAAVDYLIRNRYSYCRRDGYIIVTLRRA